MFRGLLSSRLIQVGLVFFVVVVSGSLLYSWQARRATVAEFTRADVVPHETRSEQDTVDTSTVDFEQSETPLEADDSQMADDTDVSPIDETSEMLDMADAFLPDDFVSEEAPAEDAPVSPYGFGPYPEVPADYPFTPFWLRPPPKGNKTRERLMRKELLSRVMVKAWTEGDHDFIGASSEDGGKVYLTYPDVIYVRYGEPEKNDDGVLIRPIKDMESAGVLISPEDARNGKTPAGYKVIEFGDAGYDPYTYLDLPEP